MVKQKKEKISVNSSLKNNLLIYEYNLIKFAQLVPRIFFNIKNCFLCWLKEKLWMHIVQGECFQQNMILNKNCISKDILRN